MPGIFSANIEMQWQVTTELAPCIGLPIDLWQTLYKKKFLKESPELVRQYSSAKVTREHCPSQRGCCETGWLKLLVTSQAPHPHLFHEYFQHILAMRPHRFITFACKSFSGMQNTCIRLVFVHGDDTKTSKECLKANFFWILTWAHAFSRNFQVPCMH